MALHELMKDTVTPEVAGDIYIKGIQNDSRKVSDGDLFVAYQGTQSHGVEFAEQAQRNGAVAVLYDEQCTLPADYDLPAIRVANLRERFGNLVSRFYQHLSMSLPVIAVTGTDGKTSTTHFIAQALNASGKHCGLIGTLGSGLLDDLTPSLNTTPDALVIHHTLSTLIEKGGDCLVIEASSQGIDQGRLNGLSIDVAVFTNIGLDHLDYHATLDNYIATKCQLFERADLSHAVINCSDTYSQEFISVCAGHTQVIKYALFDDSADIFLTDLATSISGTVMHINAFGESLKVKTKLLGKFNAENILAVLGVLHTQDVDLMSASTYLSNLCPVDGRMQVFHNDNGALIVLDYAHTPNALEKALSVCRDYCQNELVCVFGCGGERDRTKRAAMGTVAEQIADKVILTNDNPRSEDPKRIINDIKRGVTRHSVVDVILDRARAIRQSVAQASAGDIVVIAGKGHEEYQIIGDKTIRLSDAECIADAIRAK